jgi:hypothetical protein
VFDRKHELLRLIERVRVGYSTSIISWSAIEACTRWGVSRISKVSWRSTKTAATWQLAQGVVEDQEPNLQPGKRKAVV